MTFGVDCTGFDSSMRRRKVEYFSARGCALRWVSKNQLAVTVYSPCPRIIPGRRCGAYENRPEACRDYDCRNDEYLPKGGKYNP
jgi:Fe-S-cluster containining protein